MEHLCTKSRIKETVLNALCSEWKDLQWQKHAVKRCKKAVIRKKTFFKSCSQEKHALKKKTNKCSFFASFGVFVEGKTKENFQVQFRLIMVGPGHNPGNFSAVDAYQLPATSKKCIMNLQLLTCGNLSTQF